MRTDRRLKRTDLFLVRVWTQDGDAGDSSGQGEWHGKVQRVVDGETHQFDDWQHLMDLLVAMVSGTGSEGSSKDPEAMR